MQLMSRDPRMARESEHLSREAVDLVMGDVELGALSGMSDASTAGVCRCR
jgi:hypothetical protein